ncbi:hypothetical protein V6N12_016398 [Hibiscus sabdariffa]|uniref:Uncharacterized protein n=1 Tax=Hibiscus sabdariffa TaxID=183260 RepID=A0ABR2CDH3_9ROSI
MEFKEWMWSLINKVNTDGGRRLQDGVATCGGVIRNDAGRWISRKGNYVTYRMTRLTVMDDLNVQTSVDLSFLVAGLVLLEIEVPS